MAIAADAKDWRINLSETRSQHAVLQKLFPDAGLVLERVANEARPASAFGASPLCDH